MMTPCRNRRTGELYLRLATGIDTTNERNGLTVVIYCPDDNENTIYVREAEEFNRNFEPVGQQ
jgi:ribulose bisphosphate carboxylase small subunit